MTTGAVAVKARFARSEGENAIAPAPNDGGVAPHGLVVTVKKYGADAFPCESRTSTASS